MIFLCYLFPPLAVLLMGRPFSAVLNLGLTAFMFWVPGIRHALYCYADYKAERHAIHNPSHARNRCCGR